MSRNVEEALNYSERGWAVFPLSPLSKLPLISREKGGHGVHDATTSASQIEQWWRDCPNANIGLACGQPSKFVVIDIDPKNGGDKSIFALSNIGYELPPTITVKTPNKGLHLYYRYESWITNSSKALGVGVDILSSGKPITAPPSVVRDLQGVPRKYTWDIEDETIGEPAPLPFWMQKFFQPPPRISLESYDAQANGDIRSLGAWLVRSGNARGDRNNRVFWAASAAADMIKCGKASRLAAERELLAAASSIGLRSCEALPTIRSGLKNV